MRGCEVHVEVLRTDVAIIGGGLSASGCRRRHRVARARIAQRLPALQSRAGQTNELLTQYLEGRS
jgi:hypothetical protein